MSFSLDYNDIEQRIKLLYSATDKYIDYTPIKRPEITQQTINKSEGKTVLTIGIGSKEITKEEEINILASINQIISNIANLKDNTINALKSTETLDNQANRIVNTLINESNYLSIITDLDNQNKHGSPLTRTNRSNLNPTIKNIHYKMIAPLHFGWVSIFNEGKIVFEADIVSEDGTHKLSFRDVIENAISTWENFYIEYLPTKANDILKRRKRKKDWKRKYNEFLELERVTQVELRNQDNWRAVPPEFISEGLLVQAFDKESSKVISGGIVMNEFYCDKTSSKQVTLYNVFLLGNIESIIANHYKWIIFKGRTKEVHSKVSEYYSRLDEMKKSANKSQFGDQ